MIHSSSSEDRRQMLPTKAIMVVALCIYAVIPALAERFVLDGVGYTVTSAVQKTVRVDSIGLPGQTSGQDTIRILIPEKVVNADTEYAVNEVGSEGQTELINVGYTSKPFIIQFPSSLTRLHKGTLTHPNACLVFSPMQAVFPGEMFRDCTIYSLALPEGMTEISNNFARNCRIYGEVRLPSTMRRIGDYAFAGDKFYESKDFEYSNRIKFVFNYGLQSIGYKAFFYCNPITVRRDNNDSNTLVLPGTLTSVGESAFERMDYMMTVELPASLKVVPKRMLACCTYLRKIVIPEGIERIEAEALSDNGGEVYKWPYGYSRYGAYHFELPSTIKYVGKNAFNNPCQLISIVSYAPVPPATSGTLAGKIAKDVLLQVPRNAYTRYRSDANWGRFLTEALDDGYCTVTVRQNIKEGGTVSHLTQIRIGSTATVKAQAAQGYTFKGWERNGAIVATTPEYNITGVYDSQIITAIFAPVNGATARPDDYYSTYYYTPGGSGSLPISGIALRHGVDKAAEWDFDFTEVKDGRYGVKAYFRHADAKTYPDTVASTFSGENYTYLVAEDGRDTYRPYLEPSIVFDPKRFPLTAVYDASGNLQPSCRYVMEIPIRHKTSGEKAVMTYTADIYMPGTKDPELERDFYGQESLIVYKGGYYLNVKAGSLDRTNGFDVELVVDRYNIQHKQWSNVHRYKYNYKAGECPVPEDDGSYTHEGGTLGIDIDTRYAVAMFQSEGTISSGSNYRFTIRARNYNADGTPRPWVEQCVGRSGRDESLQALCGNIVVYKLNNGENYQGSTIAKSTSLRDSTVDFDNGWVVSMYKDYYNAYAARNWKKVYEYNHRGIYQDDLDELLYNSYLMEVKVKNFPERWGRWQVLVEKKDADSGTTTAVARAGSRYDYDVAREFRNNRGFTRLAFPSDGKTHRWALYWPDIDLLREYTFTDKNNETDNMYCINMEFNGAGLADIEDILMVYETKAGEVKRRTYGRNEWYGSNIYTDADGVKFTRKQRALILTEPEGIKRVIAVTDTVPEGAAHNVLIPGRLDVVRSVHSYSDAKSPIMVDVAKDGSPRERNLVSITGVTDMYVRLVDASTGKTITSGITYWAGDSDTKHNTPQMVNGMAKISVVSAIYGGVYSQYAFFADGYVPQILYGTPEIQGQTAYIGGYTAKYEGDDLVLTLPMRRRVGKRPFDVVAVRYRTPGVDGVDAEDPGWQDVVYNGPSTRIAYEGGYRPKGLNTMAITVVYYNDYTISERRKNPEKDKWKGDTGALSSITLKALTGKYDGTANEVTFPLVTKYLSGIMAPRYDIVGFGLVEDKDLGYNGVGCHYYKYRRYPQCKYMFATYEGIPGSLVNNERESMVTIALKSRDRIDLCRFKNLTENAMYMADGLEYDTPIGEERVSEMSAKEDLGKEFQQTFADFEVELPTDNFLPFNIGVQKIGRDYVIRGAMSYNILPGGTMSDMLDKVGFANDMDGVFYELQRTVTRDDHERSIHENAFNNSGAFVGVRGWLDGRFVRTESGHFVPRPGGIGLKVEASGTVQSKLWTPFFCVGSALQGEVSTAVSLAYPEEHDLQWAVSSDDKFKMDLVQQTTVNLTTSFMVQAGVDIYIAKAVCGVIGSLGGSFDSEVRYKPYLRHAHEIYDDSSDPDKPEKKPEFYLYNGSRMSLSGSLEAYAEVKFLWWKNRQSYTLFSFDKKWYDPDDASNPLWQRDNGGNSSSTGLRLLNSDYRPLQLNADVLKTASSIVTNVDTYAGPRYIFGGKDMAFFRLNATDMQASTVETVKGGVLTATDGKPLMSADAASAGSKGIIVMEASTAPADKTFDVNDSPKYVGVKASLYNGGTWSEPVLLSSANDANYTPRAAVNDAGQGLVIWKGGEYVPSYVDSDDSGSIGGTVNGALYGALYDGVKWSAEKAMTTMDNDHPIADYAVAMGQDGTAFALLSVMRTEREINRIGNELDNSFLATLVYKDGEPSYTMHTDCSGSRPQIVSCSAGVFAAATDIDQNGNADIRLYNIMDDGSLQDLGFLGLGQRSVLDYRLIASDNADAPLAVVWKEVRKHVTDRATGAFEAKTQVYAALIRGAADAAADNGMVYLSASRLIAEAPAGLDIAGFDGYINADGGVTAAVTIFDIATGGANIVENSATFDNVVSIERAGIDTAVEKNKDFGYFVTVYNNGRDAIDYIDIKLGDEGVKRTVSTTLFPGNSVDLSDMVLYTADLEKGLVPYITPHFTPNPAIERPYKVAASKTARAPRHRSSVSTPETPITLNVVDMVVSPLSVRVLGDDKDFEPGEIGECEDAGEIPELDKTEEDGFTNVLFAVSNNSPVALGSGYNTNVALYLDPNGTAPYKYAHEVNLAASDFDRDSGMAVARFDIGAVPEDIMVYAVAVTTDAMGNVVPDQNYRDNAVEVFLYKNDITTIPDGVDDITKDEDVADAGFVVANDGDAVVVSNLTPGSTLRVYGINGVLYNLFSVPENCSEHRVTLPAKGVYIFTDTAKTVKFRH